MRRVQFPLMAVGLAALVVRVWARLVRMGWDLKPRDSDLPAAPMTFLIDTLWAMAATRSRSNRRRLDTATGETLDLSARR